MTCSLYLMWRKRTSSRVALEVMRLVRLIFFSILSKTMLASHPKGENGIMSPQKLRTIIQNTRSLRYYDFERIGNDTLQLVSGLFTNFSKARVQRCRILLKLFECYLQITDQKFIFPNAVDPQLDYTIDLFIGALCSNIFLNAKAAQRYGFIKLLIELLDALKISQFLSINRS